MNICIIAPSNSNGKVVSLSESGPKWRWQNAGKNEKAPSKDLKIKPTHLDICPRDAITMIPRPSA